MYNLPNYVGELVFPAHAGMSRLDSLTAQTPLSFPRSRGDEPLVF